MTDLAFVGAGAHVRFARLHRDAGSSAFAAATDHRIIVHASDFTWSWCTASGDRHLRIFGDLDLIPAGEEGGFGADTSYEALEIRVAPSLVERLSRLHAIDSKQPVVAARHLIRSEPVVHLARALESDRRPASANLSSLRDGIAVALAGQLASLSRTREAPKPSLRVQQLQRVFEFIDANLGQPLRIDSLARVAGVSSSHLRRGFKEATGLTVHRYILRRRVERARQLLVGGELTTSAVAFSAGFAHQSHLARWMRRELGMTPRELRRSRNDQSGPEGLADG